mmetsp:Transcript_5338/g.11770  ORF Transcript_5338/g.11770 Transcript_5338/m.11770 type:complete len:128 (-) Transcript_5338:44-427(-)
MDSHEFIHKPSIADCILVSSSIAFTRRLFLVFFRCYHISAHQLVIESSRVSDALRLKTFSMTKFGLFHLSVIFMVMKLSWEVLLVRCVCRGSGLFSVGDEVLENNIVLMLYCICLPMLVIYYYITAT